MQVIFGFLSSVLGIYSLLLVARIILTWFSGNRQSGITQFLSRITDPYINWWRQHFNLRAGFLDLSPIIAISALSVVQRIFSTLAVHGTITLGLVGAIVITALWSIVSFLLGMCVIVLVVRLVGYLMNKEMYGTFWQIVDSISRPLMFRITKIVFRDRSVNFVTGIVVSILLLGAAWLFGRILIATLAAMMLAGPTVRTPT